MNAADEARLRLEAADRAVADALEVCGMVRDSDCDPGLVHRRLRYLGRLELEQITIALACMVDVDRPAGELLAWTAYLRPALEEAAGGGGDVVSRWHPPAVETIGGRRPR